MGLLYLAGTFLIRLAGIGVSSLNKQEFQIKKINHLSIYDLLLQQSHEESKDKNHYCRQFWAQGLTT